MRTDSRLIEFLFEEFKKVYLGKNEDLNECFAIWFDKLDKQQIVIFSELAIQWHINKFYEN